MRRFTLVVTVALLMMVVLLASGGAVLAKPVICAYDDCPPGHPNGTPLPALVCETPVATSPLIGWRGGTCWVFHPVSVVGF